MLATRDRLSMKLNLNWLKVNEMGQRVIQRILECGDCGRTPDDGEYMWEMNGQYICSECIDKPDELIESPDLVD